MEAVVSETLISAGISPHLIGFVYLKNAIYLILDNPELQYKIMILYKKIAEIYDVDYKRIERAIRYAIETAYSDNNTALINFTSSHNLPRNSELISLAAEKIRIKLLRG